MRLAPTLFHRQTVTDKLIGATLLAAALVILSYYTAWVFVTVSYLVAPKQSRRRNTARATGHAHTSRRLPHRAPAPRSPPPRLWLQPFMPADSPLQAYFLDRSLAVAIPTVLFAGAVVLGATLIAAIMLKAQLGKKRR